MRGPHADYTGKAKERHLDRSVAVDDGGEGIGLLLRNRSAGQKRNFGGERGQIEKAIAEELEVYRLPVPEIQGKRGSPIEYELTRYGLKLVPQSALRGRKDAEVG